MNYKPKLNPVITTIRLLYDFKFLVHYSCWLEHYSVAQKSHYNVTEQCKCHIQSSPLGSRILCIVHAHCNGAPYVTYSCNVPLTLPSPALRRYRSTFLGFRRILEQSLYHNPNTSSAAWGTIRYTEYWVLADGLNAKKYYSTYCVYIFNHYYNRKGYKTPPTSGKSLSPCGASHLSYTLTFSLSFLSAKVVIFKKNAAQGGVVFNIASPLLQKRRFVEDLTVPPPKKSPRSGLIVGRRKPTYI